MNETTSQVRLNGIDIKTLSTPDILTILKNGIQIINAEGIEVEEARQYVLDQLRLELAIRNMNEGFYNG